MAEPFAIAAAAVQFLDFGGQILIKLSRLCSELRDVPEKIERARQDLQRFLSLIQTLKQDLETSSTRRASTLKGTISSARLDLAKNAIKQFIYEADKLCRTLDGLVSKQSDNLFKRGWRTVVSVKKEKQIIQGLARLEQFKTYLSLWYDHESLQLMGSLLLTGEHTSSLVQDVDRKISTVSGQFTDLKDDVHSLNQSVQTTIEQTKAGMRLFDQEISNIIEKLTNLSTTVQATDTSAESRINELGHDPTKTNTAIHFQQGEVDRLAHELAIRLTSKPSLTYEYMFAGALEKSRFSQLQTRQMRNYQRVVPCGCRSFSSSSRTSWTPKQLYFQKQEQHKPSCPFYPRSERSWTLGIRAILPRLLARSISLAFTATWGAGGFSISHSLSGIRVVDRKKSPAFLEVLRARRKLHEVIDAVVDVNSVGSYKTADKMRPIFQVMYDNLAMHFRSGKASGYDQDQDGTTILHEFVAFVGKTGIIQEHLEDQIEQIVKLLVEWRVDVKALSKRIHRGYDALSIALEDSKAFIAQYEVNQEEFHRIKIHQILLRYGCAVYYGNIPVHILTNPNRWPGYEKWLLRFIFENPDYISDLTRSEVSEAVIHRSESGLRHLLCAGHDANGDRHEIFTPLSLAIGWPTGMKILLEAGADTDEATTVAIKLGDAGAFKMLLDHGCPLFYTPGEWTIGERTNRYSDIIWGSALSTAVLLPSTDEIILLIIQAMAERRRQLMTLAYEKLSRKQLELLPLQVLRGHTLLDEGAGRIFLALQAAGVTVPSALWPGVHASVHHIAGNIGVTNLLYDCGFRSIDVKDDMGNTPLLIQCYNGQLQSLRWYLVKGATMDGFDSTHPINILHALAIVSGNDWTDDRSWHLVRDRLSSDEAVAKGLPWSEKSVIQERFLYYDPILKRISSVCGPMSTDTCVCFCSSFGCTQIALLFKRQERVNPWIVKMNRLKKWLEVSEVTPSLSEACYTEFCRLELFERLGMAHTCCTYVPYYPKHTLVLKKQEMDSDERRELRDEDSRLEVILNAYMELYKDLRKEHSGSFWAFWDAWWQAVTCSLPERNWRSNGGFLVEVSDDEEGFMEDPSGGDGMEFKAGCELDEQIRTMMRSLLHYSNEEDSADVFFDSLEYLFHGHDVI